MTIDQHVVGWVERSMKMNVQHRTSNVQHRMKKQTSNTEHCWIPILGNSFSLRFLRLFAANYFSCFSFALSINFFWPKGQSGVIPFFEILRFAVQSRPGHRSGRFDRNGDIDLWSLIRGVRKISNHGGPKYSQISIPRVNRTLRKPVAELKSTTWWHLTWWYQA